MKTQVYLWQIFCLTLLWDIILSANIFAYNKPSIKRAIRFYQYPYADKSEPCVCQQPCLNVSVSIQSNCPCAFQPNGVQPCPLPTPAQNPLPLSIATTIPFTTTSAPTSTTQVVTTSTAPTTTTEVPTTITPSIGHGAPLQQQPSQPQQYWCPYPRVCTYYQPQRVVPIPIAYQPSTIACYPACVGNAICLMGTCTCSSSIVYSPTSGCSKILSPVQPTYYLPAYQNALFLCALNKDENCYKAKLLQKV
uniref:EB domain-containing protein n=1 Tax=Acrobeloides nanus TaxID=290746 RepID=A0A914DHM6_9BILA